MQTATRKFTLLTGVECEVTELTGKQQRLLTEQNTSDTSENLVNMIHSILVRVGSLTGNAITKEFIYEMLSGDRKRILEEARQFSMRGTDYQDKFVFNWEYQKRGGSTKEKHEVEVSLKDGFPRKPYQTFGPDGKTLIPIKCEEYKDVPRTIETFLPRTKSKVIMNRLNGHGEASGASIKEKDRNSHISLLMRNPRYFEGETPIQLDQGALDRLPLIDIEHLRKLVYDLEGDVDTVVIFEHPEAEKLPANKKEVRVDLLQQVAFFFPSEAI